jgi:uncharacterized membrane protein YhaH (DUF805 family)
MRTALLVTAILLTFVGLDYLFDRSGGSLLYLVALLVIGGAMLAFCTRRLHDTFALSALGLSLNVMLVGLLAHLLFDNGSGERVPELVFIGLAAAALLAGTVSFVLKQSRLHDEGEKA